MGRGVCFFNLIKEIKMENTLKLYITPVQNRQELLVFVKNGEEFSFKVGSDYFEKEALTALMSSVLDLEDGEDSYNRTIIHLLQNCGPLDIYLEKEDEDLYIEFIEEFSDTNEKIITKLTVTYQEFRNAVIDAVKVTIRENGILGYFESCGIGWGGIPIDKIFELFGIKTKEREGYALYSDINEEINVLKEIANQPRQLSLFKE